MTIKLKALAEGATRFSGTVTSLADTNQPPKNLASPGATFIAGTVLQLIEAPGRHARSLVYPLPIPAVAQTAPSRNRRATPASCTKESDRVPGDVNGDCKVDVNDLGFLQQWVSLSVSGSTDYTDNDKAILAVIKAFGAAAWETAADFDYNGKTQLGDALFLMRVIGGKRVLVHDIAEVVSGCEFTLTAKVFLPAGTLAFCSVSKDSDGCSAVDENLGTGVRLLALFSHPQATFTQQFADSLDSLKVGTAVKLATSGGTHTPGGFVEATAQVKDAKLVVSAAGTVGAEVEFVVQMGVDFLVSQEKVGLSVVEAVRIPGQSKGKDVFGADATLQ